MRSTTSSRRSSGNAAGLDRLASGRLLGQPRDVHVAVVGEHQRARDRRRRHHQDVGRLALGGERQALVDAEAMLLVDDDERQIAEFDAGLEQRVRADEEIDGSVFQSGEDGVALAAPLAARSDGEAEPAASASGADRALVLADEELGRRHQRGLAPGLDDVGGGKQRDDRLARADIALEQAQHALALGRGRTGYRSAPLPGFRSG
jgi:hypothetical protein